MLYQHYQHSVIMLLFTQLHTFCNNVIVKFTQLPTLCNVIVELDSCQYYVMLFLSLHIRQHSVIMLLLSIYRYTTLCNVIVEFTQLHNIILCYC